MYSGEMPLEEIVCTIDGFGRNYIHLFDIMYPVLCLPVLLPFSLLPVEINAPKWQYFRAKIAREGGIF